MSDLNSILFEGTVADMSAYDPRTCTAIRLEVESTRHYKVNGEGKQLTETTMIPVEITGKAIAQAHSWVKKSVGIRVVGRVAYSDYLKGLYIVAEAVERKRHGAN